MFPCFSADIDVEKPPFPDHSPQGDELASLARAARDLSQVRASWLAWLGICMAAPGGFPFEFPSKMVTGG